MSREEEFTHEGFVYANNIYMERKCELFEVKDIAHDFVQGAIYADQHPRKGLWDSEKVVEWIKNNFSCSGHGFPLHYLHTSYQPEDIVKDLCKAMED